MTSLTRRSITYPPSGRGDIRVKSNFEKNDCFGPALAVTYPASGKGDVRVKSH